jgi:gelsolin
MIVRVFFFFEFTPPNPTPSAVTSDLHGLPVQYREIQGFESARFLSYFPHFVGLHGGVSTGFHHVSSPPPPNIRKLYRISILDRSRLVVREVALEASSLAQGDVFVLDKGTHLWQFNTKTCVGKERFEARQFVESIAVQRREEHFPVDVTVYGTLNFIIHF